MSALDNLKKLLATASPGPWKAGDRAERMPEKAMRHYGWPVLSPPTIRKTEDSTTNDIYGATVLLVAHNEYEADAKLAALARDLVQALVESQEALAFTLEAIARLVPPDAGDHLEAWELASYADSLNNARAALRLDGLAKAMRVS